MLRKTVKECKRSVLTWDADNEIYHIELVLVETWWLFWMLPIYSRETILATNI